MQTLTINIQNEAITANILSFLERFKNKGVEIVKQEDIEDLKKLAKTREDEHMSFEKYLSNEN